MSGVPNEPDHFYFGAVNGGVWETRDAGRTWAAIFDSAPVGSVGAIAISTSNPRVIYVGTGEADMRSDIAQGAGVFKSLDGGHTWVPSGLADSQQIGRILVDPHNPDRVLVAALGHPYGPNEMRGVFRSTDGGRTWQRALYKDADTGAIDLAFEPGQPDVVYASLWQTRRPPWSVYPPSSGPGGGLYKSIDGGQTWSDLSGSGLPEKPGRIGIAVAPSRAQRVFALVDAPAGGLYRSEDAGASWTRVSDDSRIWKRGWYFSGVTVDPANAEVLYVCNTAMYRSEDGGKTFLPVKGAPGGDDYHRLWIDPNNSQRQILGVDQGALVTLNGGASWSSWFNQPTGQFYHVITDNRFPYWIYGAQQDSGAVGVPSRTDNIDGINLTQFREITAGGESDNVAPDPDDPQLIFGGRVDKLDTRTNQTQNVSPVLANPDLYRGTWTLPLIFGKAGTHALYFANQRIFRTLDRGQHWDRISPDLTRDTPEIPANLDTATAADSELQSARRGVVYAIGPSPLDEHLIWAGTDDGLVWRTGDGGAHWENVTPPQLHAWSKIGGVEPSHFDPQTAYLAVDRHRLDDAKPYIYRTHDGGKTWELIVTGIATEPILNTVNVVREDPGHRGVLYCGTERGVYLSLDDGRHWHPLQQNLPRTSVRDIQVHADDLVIATHGRAFWVMDDILLLRSLADEATSGTRLFPPARAYRVHSTGFTGTPMPKDEPMGANPPPGAYIDYSLASEAGPVTLTVTDAQGAVVRTFKSTDKVAAPDLTKLEIAPDWIVSPQPPAADSGAHRFVWDLHYPSPASLTSDDPTDPENGIWAPPGQYTVELSVAGKSYRQKLVVEPDPRVKLPPSAYAQEFSLARDIESARVQIASAQAEADKIHSAIAERTRTTNSALSGPLATADAQLVTIADLQPSEKRSSDSLGPPPRTTGGLRYLATAFHDMAHTVENADFAPGADFRQAFARHRALFNQSMAEWSRFKSTTLVQLNAQLQAAGQPPLGP